VTRIHPVAFPVPAADQALPARERVRALSRHARHALRYSAELGGLTMGNLKKDPNGVPLPSRGVHWSLSHKTGWVAAVAAPFAVGIDLETLRHIQPALYARVADEAEWQQVGPPDPEGFFRLWTAKEAVLKAQGQGLNGLGRCKIDTIVNDDTLHMIFDGNLWTVTHHWFADHQVMAVTAEPRWIEWHCLAEAP
jgi:4'-phosphopantetheinyl transferase